MSTVGANHSGVVFHIPEPQHEKDSLINLMQRINLESWSHRAERRKAQIGGINAVQYMGESMILLQALQREQKQVYYNPKTANN